ncbi:MAG: dihydroorotate dehydrogenase electron transfer subunit [Actinomycetota bacterium]|nr:dihydroorotate dehydrogenase electron transfer subunit [Actinomycetota bacterium]
MPARYRVAIAEKNLFGCATELVLELPRDLEAVPGQFLHVLCGGDGRILRRPFSLTVSSSGEPALLVRPAGAGSRWLCAREAGETLDLLGPLGRGFAVLEGAREHLLVAGGAGIAPLRFLARVMRGRKLRFSLYWGVEGAGDYGTLPELLAMECRLDLATRDGSAGYRGTVLELLRESGGRPGAALYACGPREMLSGLVGGLGEEELERTQVSVEERMACGVGACRGCAVPAEGGGGSYLAACRDGPVFFAGELDWERFQDAPARRSGQGDGAR